MKVTVMLREASCGTELNIMQEGIPEMIPAEAWGGYSFVDRSGAYLVEPGASNSFGVW